jgi:hypothetical protein
MKPCPIDLLGSLRLSDHHASSVESYSHVIAAVNVKGLPPPCAFGLAHGRELYAKE